MTPFAWAEPQCEACVGPHYLSEFKRLYNNEGVKMVLMLVGTLARYSVAQIGRSRLEMLADVRALAGQALRSFLMRDGSLVYFDSAEEHYCMSAFRFDLGTHATRPLKGLTEIMRGHDWAVPISCSPDGRLFLFHIDHRYVVADQAGKVYVDWPMLRDDWPSKLDQPARADSFSTATWTSDSQSIVESVLNKVDGRSFGLSFRHRIGNTDSSAALPAVHIPLDTAIFDPMIASNITVFRLNNIWHPSSPDVTLLEWPTLHPERAVATTFSLPGRPGVLLGCLSPTGDEIVWLSHVIPPDVYKFSLSEDREPTGYAQLWITDLKGGDAVLLGNLADPTNEEAFNGLKLGQLQWLPDGKAISFVYRGKLYKWSLDVRIRARSSILGLSTSTMYDLSGCRTRRRLP